MRNGRNNFGEERYSTEVIAFLRTDKSFSQLFPSRYAGMLANAFIGPIRLQGIHEPQIVTEKVTLSIEKDLKKMGREIIAVRASPSDCHPLQQGIRTMLRGTPDAMGRSVRR